MAVWQVDYHLMPRRALAARATSLTEIREAEWWREATFPPDYRTRLAAAAPPQTAGAGREQWGVEDGNCIVVRSIEGQVTAVLVRVDVRRLDAKFGAALIAFLRAADAVLVRSDGLLVEPNIAAFGASLRGTPAWRFSQDPLGHLARPGAEEDEE